MLDSSLHKLPSVEEIQRLLKATKGPRDFSFSVRDLLEEGIRLNAKHGKAEVGRRIAEAIGADIVSVYRWARGVPPTRTWMKVTGHLASDVPAPPLLPSSRQREDTPIASNATEYIRRVEEDHREAGRPGRRKDDLVPLIQLMAALRRITASEDWPKRSAVIQVLLAFDPEVRDHWPEIQDAEVAELRRLLATGDVERQQE